MSYNGNSVVVDVCVLVEFIFKFCVFLDGPADMLMPGHVMVLCHNVLDSAGVEGSLQELVDVL